MQVQGHSIEEQWDLVEQFAGVVEHGMHQVIETWLARAGAPSALTAAAGDELVNGQSNLEQLWNAQVQGIYTTYITGTFDAAALAVAHETLSQADLPDGLGVPGVPDHFTADFVKQIMNKMVGVSDDLWANIQDQLAQGVAAGEDVDQLADRVRTAASVTLPRAQTVARTTVIQASNAGSYAQASLLAGEGGMKKRWLATDDMRTRPDHFHADGQVVAMTQPFSIGGWPLMYPGDPAGPPGEVINCRCTLTYEFDDISTVCACSGLQPDQAQQALVAAAPKLAAPMGAACVCPAVASLTPAGHASILKNQPASTKKSIYEKFQADGKITPAYGGAKIHKRLQVLQKTFGVGPKETEALLDIIDEQYALEGGKTSFKAKYEEWLQSTAGKKVVPTVVAPTPLAPTTVAPKLTQRALAPVPKPDVKNLKFVKGAGGFHDAGIYEDVTTGERWVFKPEPSYVADLEQAAAKLQARADLVHPSIYVVEMDGKIGSLQSMHAAHDMWPSGGFKPTALTADEILDLQREQIFDWFISNNDAHTGNVLQLPDGHLIGIDKGQAFRYLEQDTVLDWNATFHGLVAPNEYTYQKLWQAYADGENVELFDPSTGALKQLIDQITSIPDDQIRAYLTPYAKAALKDGTLAFGDVSKFMQAVIDRKNNLAVDFQRMYDKARTLRAEKLGLKPSPTVTAPAGSLEAAGQHVLTQLDDLGKFDLFAQWVRVGVKSGLSLDDAIVAAEGKMKFIFSTHDRKLVSALTNDDLTYAIRAYGDYTGTDTTWIGGKLAPPPVVTPTVVAPVTAAPSIGGTVQTLADVQDIAYDFGLDPNELEDVFNSLKHDVELTHGDLAKGLGNFGGKMHHLLSPQTADAIDQLDDTKLIDLMKSYGDVEGLDTAWLGGSTLVGGPVDYNKLWTTAAAGNHTKLFKAFNYVEQQYTLHGDVEQAFVELKQYITNEPGQWPAYIKGLSDEDLRGLVKVAGEQLGMDTMFLEPPAFKAQELLAVSKYDAKDMYNLLYQNYQSYGDLAQAVQELKLSLDGSHFSQKFDELAAEMTNEELVEAAKQYGLTTGEDLSWLNGPATVPVAAPTTVAATPATGVIDLLDISTLTDAQVKNLLGAFKALKPVTPKWKGAAVFKQLQELKKSITGFPEYAGLNDGQLLKALDKAIGAAPGPTTSYYDATMEWLKTPGGKKYLTDNGLLPPPEPGVVPATTPTAIAVTPPVVPVVPMAPTTLPADVPAAITTAIAKSMSNELYGYFGKITDKSTGAKLYQELQKLKAKFTVAKDLSTVQLAKIIDSAGVKTDTLARLEKWFKTPKGKLAYQDELTSFAPKAAYGVTAPNAGLTFGTGDISAVPDHIQMSVYSKIKSSGITLPSPAESLYDALVKVQKSDPKYAGYDLLQLVRMVDAKSAQNFGVVDTHMYEQKLIAWLQTPAGNAYVNKLSYASREIGRLTPPTRFTNIPRNISQTDTTFTPMSSTEADAWRSANPPTPAQKKALFEYTRSSAPYNDPLREETISASSAGVQSRIIQAQQGMRPLPRPVLLTRGTGPQQFGFTSKATMADMQQLIGADLEDRGFISTAIQGGFSGTVRMEIEAPTGTPAAWLEGPRGSGHTNYPGENEILLAAGTRYRVLSVVESSPGYFTVRMRIIG